MSSTDPPNARFDTQRIIDKVPSGSWAVGVSGGADSVALLRVLADSTRSDLRLTVAHFNHQTRGTESDDDERFVCELADRLKLPIAVARRDEIELSQAQDEWPTNLSAHYRQMRLAFFSRIVTLQKLNGVLLAHHADDQAETVLHRLLRGSTFAGLGGMTQDTTVSNLRIVRPLLGERHASLVGYLREIGQAWREDSSNQSDAYSRNRLRAVLRQHDGLFERLIQLRDACAALHEWTRQHAPTLPEKFAVEQLNRLPRPLARESARRWLTERGVAPEEISPAVIERLLHLCGDAASASRVQFPRPVNVRRRSGVIEVSEGSAPRP